MPESQNCFEFFLEMIIKYARMHQAKRCSIVACPFLPSSRLSKEKPAEALATEVEADPSGKCERSRAEEDDTGTTGQTATWMML